MLKLIEEFDNTLPALWRYKEAERKLATEILEVTKGGEPSVVAPPRDSSHQQTVYSVDQTSGEPKIVTTSYLIGT